MTEDGMEQIAFNVLLYQRPDYAGRLVDLSWISTAFRIFSDLKERVQLIRPRRVVE